jgi:hypothetical protein
LYFSDYILVFVCIDFLRTTRKATYKDLKKSLKGAAEGVFHKTVEVFKACGKRYFGPTALQNSIQLLLVRYSHVSHLVVL